MLNGKVYLPLTGQAGEGSGERYLHCENALYRNSKRTLYPSGGHSGRNVKVGIYTGKAGPNRF